MGKIRYTALSRSIVFMVVILYAYAFLYSNLLVAAAGSAILFFLAYRLMEFRKKISRMDLRISKTTTEKIYHKDSPISVRIEAGTDESVGLSIHDPIPAYFTLKAGENEISGNAYPEKPLIATYTMIPRERGFFELPPIDVVMIESRGLFRTSVRGDPGKSLLIQASKREMAMARLMARRKQFEITGVTNRRHTRTMRADFRSIRDYMPGDRFRDIDWKAASRLTKLMTKEFEREVQLPTILMIDTSISMRELVMKRTKLDHIIGIGVQMATLLHHQGHPVGMISFDEYRVNEFRHPRKSTLDDVLLSMFRLPNPARITEYPGMLDPVPPETGGNSSDFLSKVGPFLVGRKREKMTSETTTGIYEAVREIIGTEETGMLLVIMSDLETNRYAIPRAVRMARSRKHRVILVTPFSWPYHIDPEEIDIAQAEEMYLDYVENQKFLHGLREAGVRVIEISSGEKGERAITQLGRLSR